MVTVLILEDDSTSTEVLRVLLNDRGYRLLEASSAEEAIEVCALHPARIDLTIADVVLRHADGPSITRLLKRIRPHMKILFVSGHGKDEVLNRGLLEEAELESGQSCFLQKPFTREELGEKIETLQQAREGPCVPDTIERQSIEQFLLERLETARLRFQGAGEGEREDAFNAYQRALTLFNRFVIGRGKL